MNYFFHDATHTRIKKKSGVEDLERLFTVVVIDNEDNDNINERNNERNNNINERNNNNINKELSELKDDLNELKKFLKHYVVNVNLLEKPEKSKSK
jgi:hypothetical protein